jgi:hypothetical protein
MDSHRGMRRSTRPLAAVGIAVVLMCGTQASAMAAQPVSITLKAPEQSFVYGDPWGFQAEMTGVVTGIYGGENMIPGESHVSSFDGPYGEVYFFPNGADTAAGWFGADPERAPLDAGTYDMRVSVNGAQTGSGFAYSGESEPIELEIGPAELATDVRMIADPSNPDNAVVTVGLDGQFINNLVPGLPQDEYPSLARMPAGSWHVVITDGAGSTLLDRTIEQPADGPPSATLYWTDAEPESAYTVTGSFTPVPDSQQNFAIAEAAAFPYTSPSAQRPQPTPTVAGPLVEPLESPGGASLPVWSILGAGLVALGLVVALLTLLVAGRRRASRTTKATQTSNEGQTDAAVA